MRIRPRRLRLAAAASRRLSATALFRREATAATDRVIFKARGYRAVGRDLLHQGNETSWYPIGMGKAAVDRSKYVRAEPAGSGNRCQLGSGRPDGATVETEV